ncbi:MAG: dipeptide epimerase [Rhodothermales bacterium]|nr:dipeptide epimerase [Rhodothermales bacterium]
MNISVTDLPLELHSPFRIAHGATTSRRNALVQIEEGVGEASLPPYYPHEIKDIRTYAASLELPDLSEGIPPVWSIIDSLPGGPPPAMAAVDMALFDLLGKRIGQPLYRLLGLDPTIAPPTTITLSIPDSVRELKDRLLELKGIRQIKLKLGSGDPDHDLELVRTAVQHFDGSVCVDVNAGWSLDQAARLLPRLARFDLLFIEQPIASPEREEWHQLRRLLPSGIPPLIADESHQTAEDVVELAGAADGINVKLAKCGGIAAALRTIAVARALDMRVMLGCMIESNVAVSAAAHIASLADYLDLDASIHLAHDPFAGAQLVGDRILPGDGPGLGVERVTDPADERG